MEDLIQCFATNKGFQRWLSLGKMPLTVYKDEKAAAMLVKLDKKPGVDYLYQAAVGKDNSISWDKSLMFCGLYDMKSQALYLTEDTVRSLSDGQYPLVTINCPSKVKEICGRLNLRVEEIIANDRNNLPVREVTDGIALHNLHYYQEYGAKEDAIRKFFDDEAPDGQFHSDYAMDGLRETAFLAYIQDPDGFIQAEAEKYIKANQEKFLLEFLENDALLAEYQALIQDTGNPIHRMKAITEAVKASGGKTVTVTVQKEGQELTFKTEAKSLTGYRSYYSTYDIPASDRRKFEELFGRHADYKAEDVTRITYGRNTIYEAHSFKQRNCLKNLEWEECSLDKVDFPSIYRNFLIEAERLGETELWWESFHNNVACARHIEAAIRNYFDETFERLKPGCAESVLAVWGADRVNMVLANTLQDIPSHLRHLYGGENLDWGGEAQLLPDAAYRRYYVANSSAELVDSFVTQTREICDVHFENRKNENGRRDFEPKKFQHGIKEVHMSDYGTKYLAEVSRQLQRAGFTVKPEEDDRMSVEQESQRICRVNTEGAVFYDQDTIMSFPKKSTRYCLLIGKTFMS